MIHIHYEHFLLYNSSLIEGFVQTVLGLALRPPAHKQTRITKCSICGGDAYKNMKRIDMGVKIALHRDKVSNVLPSQDEEKRDSCNIKLVTQTATRSLCLSIRSPSILPPQIGVLSKGTPALVSDLVEVLGVANFCGGTQRWLVISPVE